MLAKLGGSWLSLEAAGVYSTSCKGSWLMACTPRSGFRRWRAAAPG